MERSKIEQRMFEQLGMPFGTASNKLRKNLLFHLAKKCNMHICFRCGKEIESPDDFSIDHKKPWRNESASLFWDLDNIAFSHFQCNCGHNRKTNCFFPDNRKIGPEGTAWCARCKDFLPIKRFTKNRSRWNKLDKYCRSCRSSIRTKPRGLVTTDGSNPS